MFRIAKSEESESVRRRNFPSEGDRVSRDKQANMAVNSATKTDAFDGTLLFRFQSGGAVQGTTGSLYRLHTLKTSFL